MRDVRLDLDQLLLARDNARRRVRELERRLERTSYEGKAGMKDAVVGELGQQRELARVFDHNYEQLRRQHVERVRESLGMRV